MTQITSLVVKPLPKSFSYLLLILAIISFILISPKWTIPVFAWLGPVFLIIFYRVSAFKRTFLFVLAALIISNTIAFYKVVPIPGIGLIFFVLLSSTLSTFPYWIDQYFGNRSRLFICTLIFPCTQVVIEFFSSKGPWGVWISIANTQFTFSWLAQLASLTGIWGISFLLYWFASVSAWVYLQYISAKNYKIGLIIFISVMLIVFTYGASRLYFGNSIKTKNILAGGVAVSNIPFIEALYFDSFGKKIRIPANTSPVSNELQEANRAFIPFIENKKNIDYKTAKPVLDKLHDTLFTLSEKLAVKGVKLIVWPEGGLMTLKQDEDKLINRGRKFSSTHKVYLFMTMSTIISGKISFGTKFLENKILFISPEGKILNTYFKNKPVPVIEPSIPGNGIIPTIETSIGKISEAICYDADFPDLMKQLGKNKSELLILPSGDWNAISPHHTYAAIFRAIENGCSIIREANNGLSIASDSKGRIYGGKNFFQSGEQTWTASIPVGHTNTIYNYIGDSFAYLCLAFFVIVILILLKIKLF